MFAGGYIPVFNVKAGLLKFFCRNLKIPYFRGEVDPRTVLSLVVFGLVVPDLVKFDVSESGVEVCLDLFDVLIGFRATDDSRCDILW